MVRLASAFFLACLVLVASAAARPLREAPVVRASNSAGTMLLVELHAATPAATVALSPLSAGQAMAMLATGASGDTRREFARFFGTRASGKAMHLIGRDAEALHRALNAARDVEIALSNALWLDRSVRLNRQYPAAGIDLHRTAFASPGAAGEINAWVAARTRDQITQIVDRVPADAVFVAVNALYFKGRWKDAFDREATTPAAFRRADGTSSTVPMMRRQAKFSYGEDAEAQTLALPFAGEKVELRLVLPRDTASLPSDKASAAAWLNARRDLALALRPGRFAMPRLKIEWGGDLVEPLRAAGLGKALGPAGDYRGLASTAAAVDQVAHRVVFEADEQGAVGAAATVVITTRAITAVPPFNMTLDRPFFMFVRDRASGAVLFQAFVADTGTSG